MFSDLTSFFGEQRRQQSDQIPVNQWMGFVNTFIQSLKKAEAAHFASVLARKQQEVLAARGSLVRQRRVKARRASMHLIGRFTNTTKRRSLFNVQYRECCVWLALFCHCSTPTNLSNCRVSGVRKVFLHYDILLLDVAVVFTGCSERRDSLDVITWLVFL